MQQQRLYTAAVREQVEQKAHEQLVEARRAMNEERLQICRELHDVVAHTLSVIAVQAGVANHVAAEHPQEAHRALSSIEETVAARSVKCGHCSDSLRTDERTAQTAQNGARPAPAPKLRDLDALVERTGEVGVQVDLAISGERPDLSAGLDLAAYRVVQEAITNVIKHAMSKHCRVSIAYRPGALTLEVADDGQGDSVAFGGHGIGGMRERIGMYGGEFHAGPLPGCGFHVTATFPLTTKATP